jgi:Rps23 Pro-64 3,4-dihydroxylase Tpa1-like proline 4-hydroxylase
MKKNKETDALYEWYLTRRAKEKPFWGGKLPEHDMDIDNIIWMLKGVVLGIIASSIIFIMIKNWG